MKINTIITQDRITSAGRSVTAQITTTDNPKFNSVANFPINISKTFAPRVTLIDINQWIIAETGSIIRSIQKKNLTPETFKDKRLEVIL